MKWIRVLVLLIIGIIMCYWQIYMPIEKAKSHSDVVDYSYKMIAIGPIALVAAFMTLLAPKNYDLNNIRFIREEKKHTYFNILFLSLMLIAALGTLYWFLQTLTKLGYS